MKSLSVVGRLVSSPPASGRCFSTDIQQPVVRDDALRHFLDQFITPDSNQSPKNLFSLYRCTEANLSRQKGGKYLEKYNGKVPAMMQAAFPEHSWNADLFLDWALTSSPESRTSAIKTLQSALNISSDTDWAKKLTKYSLRKAGLVVRTRHVVSALRLDQPQLAWDQIVKDSKLNLKSYPKRKTLKSSSDIDAEDFRRRFKPHFDSFAAKIGFITLNDWYKHSKSDILKQSPEIRRVTKILRGGLSKTLRMIYPEHEWQDWKLEKVSARFWDSRENRKRFFCSIVPENQLHLWYSEDFSTENVKSKFSSAPSILKLFRGSLAAALRDSFPDHDWMEWKFVRAPHRFWNDPATRRRFFDTFAHYHKIGANEIDPWYTVTLKQISDFGGASLLRRIYSNSLHKALNDIYPEKRFQIWKFLNPHQKWWNDPQHAVAFLAPIKEQRSIQRLEDWYLVSEKDIESIGGGRVSLIDALRAAYPDHEWNSGMFKQRINKDDINVKNI